MSDSQAAVYARQILRNAEKLRAQYKNEYEWDIKRIKAIFVLSYRLLAETDPRSVEFALSILEVQL